MISLHNGCIQLFGNRIAFPVGINEIHYGFAYTERNFHVQMTVEQFYLSINRRSVNPDMEYDLLESYVFTGGIVIDKIIGNGEVAYYGIIDLFFISRKESGEVNAELTGYFGIKGMRRQELNIEIEVDRQVDKSYNLADVYCSFIQRYGQAGVDVKSQRKFGIIGIFCLFAVGKHVVDIGGHRTVRTGNQALYVEKQSRIAAGYTYGNGKGSKVVALVESVGINHVEGLVQHAARDHYVNEIFRGILSEDSEIFLENNAHFAEIEFGEYFFGIFCSSA